MNASHASPPGKPDFARARACARAGRYDEVLATCRQILQADPCNLEATLEAGALLSDCGFLGRAGECFHAACQLAPQDQRALGNLANVARLAGDHARCRELYALLVERLPDHPKVRRNALVSLEYDPAVPDPERLVQAKAWGAWATARAGGPQSRPSMLPLRGRPLRVGYVSADFCQHPVGLFVKGVLQAHDAAQVTVFAYSAGPVDDWVTAAIRQACSLRNVRDLDDDGLAALIRRDRIDVLVDLSGHTAGSRLTVFAQRPAPVQVSWLGYFATTGLDAIDAVLLDDWHAPAGTEDRFIERIVRLPHGRFCYEPVPWAPSDVAAAPFLRNGFVTFGCFNNTAKFNEQVFDVWARVLEAVPRSRLVLKWCTFNDEGLRGKVLGAFAERGISADRIELRGPSFHAELLKEYADIDIALDPFPFTGGLTSCEALWMGVPVVTWPQSRVVSRQTAAFLGVIALPELAATGADDYIRIAASLADDRARLQELRASMRARMRASPLMDLTGFTRALENTLTQLYHSIEADHASRDAKARTVLHVGPGHRHNGAKLPSAFSGAEWRELRLDIDPANQPDIVGSMLDMVAVPDASVDAVYSAHNIEHVYPHEVPVVLKEFLRVLRPEGFLLVTCPDLQSVCALVAQDRLTEPAYQSAAGPIAPLDMLYGHGAALAAGNHFMAHKGGFTLRTLTAALHSAGFATAAGKRRPHGLDLWVLATKTAVGEPEIRQLAERLLPP